MRFFIIDAIGPFFQNLGSGVTNWSKIPFARLEREGKPDETIFAEIRKDFDLFTDRVREVGFNAISIDDLPHLADLDLYDPRVRRKIHTYRRHYRDLFQKAKARGFAVFVNTDLMFFNYAIHRHTRNRDAAIIGLLNRTLEQVFSEFPVDGIIVRIGEADGVDVKGDFVSRLVVKTPGQANRYIRALLPVFERFGKYLIWRTWTFGAYPIGDLIWNPKTFERAFHGIDSDRFILSMKYGDTDFFSHLELNPLFFQGNHQRIIELQTRREREGFGAIPYYVGWEYEAFWNKLRNADNLVGVSVWCQTGGWSRWRNRTFLQDSSVWNELNTFATLKIYKDGYTADEAITAFFGDRRYVEFLKLGNALFGSLLYLKGIADRPLYFRRLRILPLLWFYWDHITINPLMRAFHAHLGCRSCEIDPRTLQQFSDLGVRLKIRNLDFYRDTLEMLISCRTAFDRGKPSKDLPERVRHFKAKYPEAFEFTLDLSDRKCRWLTGLLGLCIREGPEYRRLDRILLSSSCSRLLCLLTHLHKRSLPRFANRQAMELNVIFK